MSTYNKIIDEDECIYINHISSSTTRTIILTADSVHITNEGVNGGDESSETEFDEVLGEVIEYMRVGTHPPHAPK